LNATSNIPSLAKILLPLLAIITLWLLSGEQEEQDKEKPIIDRATDYTMTNFTVTVIDDEGKPSRVINGEEMAHYPEDDSTTILFPIAQLKEEGKDAWLISADKGSTVGKGDTILLERNVIITQPNNPDIELHTEALNLDTQQNTAYTDLPVSMKSPDGWTDSIGLHASMAEKTINLHSRVKGRYDAPPTQ